jgi:hypothetical protein
LVEHDENGPLATIGAGCRIKRALSKLDQLGLTLPALGLIDEQTVAGATATGTHGSGKHSLSHYLERVRIAHYNPATGDPVITEVRKGDALRTARCSLGCLGIVVAVSLRPRPQYNVEQRLGLYTDLDWILSEETNFPQQQFYYVPWLDRYLLQRHQETTAPRKFWLPLYRAYWFVTIDCGMHLVLRFLVQTLRSPWFVKFFYRYIAVLAVPRSCRMVGKSQDILTMQHELFRHIEIEVFVRRAQLKPSLNFIRQLIAHSDGAIDLSEPTRAALAQVGLDRAVSAARGTYTHHYPVCVRRVMPDDTLLSMASGEGEDFYALSFISYALPRERAGFFRFARLLAECMTALFDARCHWGKVCPSSASDIRRLYPRLASFRSVCRQFDPRGQFQNDWLRELLFTDPPQGG